MYDDDDDDLARPTREQIRKKCLEIQKTWGPVDFIVRSGQFRGEPRDWHFANGRSYRSGMEFGWSVPQYLVHHGEIGRSGGRRYRELRVWDRVG
jgi:hypothetical protein